jgi:flagellar assembly protein FliH
MRTDSGSVRPLTPMIFPDLGPSVRAADGRDPTAPHAIIRRAESQAQKLMEEARQSALTLVEEARREGTLQGRAQALAEARGRLQALGQDLEGAAAQLLDAARAFQARSEAVVIELSLALAARILQAEIVRDPTAILPAVQAAVKAIPAPTALLLRIHPDLASILETHRGTLQNAAAEGATIRIVSDPTVPLGGAVVEAPDVTVDATFATQLTEAGRRLREEPW